MHMWFNKDTTLSLMTKFTVHLCSQIKSSQQLGSLGTQMVVANKFHYHLICYDAFYWYKVIGKELLVKMSLIFEIIS